MDHIEDTETREEPQNSVQGVNSADMPNDDLIFNLSVDIDNISRPDDKIPEPHKTNDELL